MEKLFSYGSLQLAPVQMDTFGRILHGQPDVLIDFKKETFRIKEDAVINSGELEEYPIISFTGNGDDVIEGVVLSVTADEMLRADEYEADEYKRISVILESGITAWVYVKNDNP